MAHGRDWMVHPGTLAVVLTAVALAVGTSLASGGEDVKAWRVPVGGGRSYTNVSAPSLAVMLKNKDFRLVNVHIPYEGDIAGTDLSIPFDQVPAHLAKLPADKGAKLVLYCMSGRMSDIAARTLVGLGYTNVWNVDGGMIAWRKAGLPLIGPGPTK